MQILILSVLRSGSKVVSLLGKILLNMAQSLSWEIVRPILIAYGIRIFI